MLDIRPDHLVDAADTNKGRVVLIAAGGTGGHVFPALAVAERLRELGSYVVWVGTRRGLESQVAEGNRFPIHYINVMGIRGKNIVTLFTAPVMLFAAVISVMRLILGNRTAVVLGMGGFVSGAAGIAAILLRKPLLLQEQNAIPGTTNKYLAPFAKKIFTGFKTAFSNRDNVCYSGNPLRSAITSFDHLPAQSISEKTSIRILIVGGSLGASVFNTVLPSTIQLLKDQFCSRLVFTVMHQTGNHVANTVQEAYNMAGVAAEVTPFIEDIAQAYADADLVIARAGALTVSELLAMRVASILIPYPHAVDDHQSANAQSLVDCGAAVLIPQDQFKVDSLVDVMAELLHNQSTLDDMAEQARKNAQTQGATLVADACREFAQYG